MTAVMTPRGPDGAGVWSQGRVALGHRRLKIIDLTEAGAQPMIDSDLGLSIAWNGCIYNYRELRDELEGYGYQFFSHSDSEVLLKAYHRWGDDFVEPFQRDVRFRHRRARQRPRVARPGPARHQAAVCDRGQSRIRFASTLPALLAGGGVDTPIDHVALTTT